MIDYDRRYLFLSVTSFSATKEIKNNCANLYKMPACKRKNSCLTLTGRYFSRVVLLRPQPDTGSDDQDPTVRVVFSILTMLLISIPFFSIK